MSDLALTREEFERLFAAEAAALDPAARAILIRYGVLPFKAEYQFERVSGPAGSPVWIIARSGDLVLGYDEVEEEYGIGQLGAGGHVADWGTFGERLHWSLIRFPHANQSIG